MATVKYTGPVASFHCPTNAEIRSLKVHFSPKQEGSGDPSPENVREIVGWDGVNAYRKGKNLLNISDDNIIYENYSKTTDGSYYQIDNNIIKLYNATAASRMICFPITPITESMINTVFTLSFESSGTGDCGIYISDLDGSNRTTNKNNPYTIFASDIGKLLGVRIRINGYAGLYTVSNIQFELGSIATSYEPYSGSTTDYEFGVLGKNKFDKDTVTNNSWIRAGNLSEENPLGSIKENANGYSLSSYIQVIPNTTYTIKYNVTSLATAAGMVFFSEQDPNSAISGISLYYQTYINSSTTREYYTFTTPSNCNYVRISTPPNASDVQLELGSTATAYESYNPKHTVYGGWVDLITGEAQEEYTLLDKPWSEWGNKTIFEDGTELRYIKFEVPVKGNGTSNFKTSLCNVTKYLYGNENGQIHYYIVGNSYNCRVYLPTGTDENTRVQVLGELVTPITYYLTPTQLQTFLGQNNIWSNADYVEVEYDLHETQDILARKQFIIANQPHIATLPTASFQHFTTSVPAPIKECKVYLSPIQTGEGTPNPNNIMPITGHDVMKLHRSGKNVFDMNCFNTGQVTVENDIATGTGTNFNKTFNSPYYIPLDMDLSTSRWSMSMTAYTEGNSSTADKSGLMIGMIYTDETNKKVYFNNQNTSPVTLTLTNAEDKILEGFRMSYAFSGGNIWHVTGVQLEYGATVSQYEPYNGITIPITLPSTLYGSTINLTTGEITQNYQLFSFDGTENWETAVFSTPGPSSRIMIWLDTISGHNNYDQHNNKSVYCSHFSYGGTASTTFGEYRYNPISGSPPRAYFAIMDPNTEHFSTLANFKQFLADQATNDTPVQVLIPLTVPKHYQINPITLKTLRGINNVWSDAGNISLKYWTY